MPHHVANRDANPAESLDPTAPGGAIENHRFGLREEIEGGLPNLSHPVDDLGADHVAENEVDDDYVRTLGIEDLNRPAAGFRRAYRVAIHCEGESVQLQVGEIIIDKEDLHRLGQR